MWGKLVLLIDVNTKRLGICIQLPFQFPCQPAVNGSGL